MTDLLHIHLNIKTYLYTKQLKQLLPFIYSAGLYFLFWFAKVQVPRSAKDVEASSIAPLKVCVKLSHK